MSVRLIDSLATTDELAELFSDAAVLQAMLDVEVALARAAAQVGAAPQEAADAIARAAQLPGGIDPGAIAREARDCGTPTIPFVQAFRRLVRTIDTDSAGFVHWGATSQDVSDSALLLLVKRARPLLARDHARLDSALRDLSNAHAQTVMLGRTLLQPATPITFGLKVAGWWAAIDRSWRRLASAWDDVLVLQFGGGAGTRAAAGAYAAGLADALAAELGLASGPPWHTDRDRLGAFVSACGLYTAALGKAGRDLALLMQAEVGEVSEQGGGSSTMPHKRNPSGSAIVVAAATRMPGIVSAFLGGMLQEHERSAGGGQAEWPTVASAVQTTGAAAAALARVCSGLTVDAARMRANIDATRGLIFAERAVTLLAPQIGREAAQKLVAAAVRKTRNTNRTFAEVLRSLPEVSGALPEDVLREVDRPEAYLGDAERLRKQLLAGRD